MIVQILMPQLGESVVEGTVSRWLVKPGDVIKKDQFLATISTDKAETDIPSEVSGTVVELLVKEGETLPVKSPIAKVDTDKAAAAAASAAAPTPAPATPTPQPPTTPKVRNMAREHDVDVTKIQGSGENGRVTPADVIAAVEKRATNPTPAVQTPPQQAPAERPEPRPAPVQPAAQPVAQSVAQPVAAPARTGGFSVKPYNPSPGDEVVPFNRRRQIIADHMVYSKQVSPHVYTFAEIDMHGVSRLRESKKEAYKAEGVSLTFLAFIAAATARALRENPVLNARVLDNAYVKLRNINLGIAVETPGGLLVPVIRNADELSVKGVARAIETLARKAREGKIEADDLAGATFTISNPGPKGNFVGAAVISQPNVGILRTGEIVKRPVVVEVDGADSIAIHPVMFSALSYDHRIVDGVAANDFLFRITELLEAARFEL